MQEGEKEGNLFVWLQKRENLGRAFLVARPHDLDGPADCASPAGNPSAHDHTFSLLTPLIPAQLWSRSLFGGDNFARALRAYSCLGRDGLIYWLHFN